MIRTGLHILFFAIMAAVIAFPAAVMAEVLFGGSISNQMRVRLLQEDMPKGYDWDISTLLTTVDFVARASNEERTGRMFLDMDFRYDPTGVFKNENDIEWRIKEAYGGYYSTYFTLEAGKKIYSWGKADEFNPTDLINPEDLRWFITMDRPDRKIGVYSVNMILSYQKFSWQAVAVPVFTPDILPARDSQWLPWQLEELYQIQEAFPQYVEFRQVLPKINIHNASVATRFYGTLGKVDFEAMYYNGMDPLPTFDAKIDANAEKLIQGGKALFIRQEYQRYQAAGGSFNFTQGGFGFRGEGAYYSRRYWMHDLDPSLLEVTDPLKGYEILKDMQGQSWRSKRDNWSAAGGFDWRKGTTLYLNFQYVHTQILDYKNILIDQQNEGIVTAKIQTTWLDEDLEVGFNGAFNVWHYDWLAKPYVRFKFTPDFSGELGAQIFGGAWDTRFGDMNYNDFLYTIFSYKF